MTETMKGLAIGAALVGGYFLWTRRSRPDGRRSSSLDGSTPTSTLAAAWRSGSAAWMAGQPTVAPPGGGLSLLPMRGVPAPGSAPRGAYWNGYNWVENGIAFAI